MKTKIAIFATALIAAGLISSCVKNPTSPYGNQMVGFVRSPIDTVIASFSDYPMSATYSDSAVDSYVDSTQSQKYIVKQTTYNASENANGFMEFDPNAGVLYPGDLVGGNSVRDGVLNTLAVPRAGGTVTLDILSGIDNDDSRHVDSMSYSAVHHAMNSILAGYHGGTPGRLSYAMKQVYSATQLHSDLDLGYSGPTNKVNSSLNFDFSTSKTHFVVELMQQFFTMSIDEPSEPQDMIGPGITPDELKSVLEEAGPACYISSVTYGRIFLLDYTSTASSTQLNAALQYAYSGGLSSGDVKTTDDFNNVMKQTTVQAMAIGGDADSALGAALNFDKLQSFLNDGEFSPSNIGEPISYRVNYLADNDLMALNNTTQYTVTEKIPLGAFSIFFDRLNVTRLRFDNMHGGCKIVVGMTNNITGKDSIIWTSPVSPSTTHYYPYYDGAGFYDFGSDLMNDNKDYPLYWTVPQFLIPGSTDSKLWIDFFVTDFEYSPDPTEAKWVWGRARAYVEYNQTTGTWEITQGIEAANSVPITDCPNGDVFGKFVYTISFNGSNLSP